MKIITISGLDGSGKSTQIQLLKKYLESQGQRAYYFHAIQFSIANKMTGIFNYCHPEQSRGISSENNGIATITTFPRNDKQKSISRTGWLGIFLRKIALRIDLLRFKLLHNRLRNKSFDYILSDRYFYDTVVNIKYLENKKCHPETLDSGSETGMTLGHFVSKWIIKPHSAIYLQVSPEIIMQRDRVPDQGMEYLLKKKELYDSYAGTFAMKIIDGNRNREEIFEEIKQAVCQI